MYTRERRPGKTSQHARAEIEEVVGIWREYHDYITPEEAI